jgi:hypothetical protein
MKDAKERIIKITDIITIVVAIIISVIAFIIDGYNSYVDNGVKIDYAFVATSLLLAIAIHFILVGFLEDEITSRQKELTQGLEQAVGTIIDSLNGVEVICILRKEYWQHRSACMILTGRISCQLIHTIES